MQGQHDYLNLYNNRQFANNNYNRESDLEILKISIISENYRGNKLMYVILS